MTNNQSNTILIFSYDIGSDEMAGPVIRYYQMARMLAQSTALLLARAGDYFHPWLTERKGLCHLSGDGFTNRLE